MSLKKFILSKFFLKNLGYAAAIFTGIMILLLIWLNIYTRHGQERIIPDFAGKTMEEAVALSERNRFRLVLTDSVYTTQVPRGTIAEQNPHPGYKSKKHRRVNITINAFNPELAAVPRLTGMPLRAALSTLKTAGFEAGDLTYVPDLSVDFVLKQLHNGIEIMAGDTLVKGATIDLVLGSGLSLRRTSIPYLTGQRLDEARNTILTSSLNLGAFVYDTTVVNATDSLLAFVFRQNPEFNENATMQLGSRLYLWLTLDSAKLPVDSTLLMLPDSLKIFNDSLFLPPRDSI